MNITQTPRIAIIGAGPGGLICARILQQHGITAAVYDRDAGPAARDQGGTLDLHADNGQIALREAGLLEEFFQLARLEGQEMRQMDPAGTILFHHVPSKMSGSNGNRPRPAARPAAQLAPARHRALGPRPADRQRPR